jgi:hypothetical protein
MNDTFNWNTSLAHHDVDRNGLHTQLWLTIFTITYSIYFIISIIQLLYDYGIIGYRSRPIPIVKLVFHWVALPSSILQMLSFHLDVIGRAGPLILRQQWQASYVDVVWIWLYLSMTTVHRANGHSAPSTTKWLIAWWCALNHTLGLVLSIIIAVKGDRITFIVNQLYLAIEPFALASVSWGTWWSLRSQVSGCWEKISTKVDGLPLCRY